MCTNGLLSNTDGVFAHYNSDERLLITHCHSGAIKLSVPVSDVSAYAVFAPYDQKRLEL